MIPTNQTQVATRDKSEFTFVPLGETMPISLSLAITRKNFCKATKSGVHPSDQDVLAFAMQCRSLGMNPFLGDCWLTGYDSKDGPQFSILTSQRVLLKRAELHPAFDGIESGITVETEAGELVDLNSEIQTKSRAVVGAWCRVHRKDRTRPYYKQIGFAGLIKTTRFWQENPNGMLVKCAESDCLRFAFPSTNGGLYTREESALVDIGGISSAMRTDVPQTRLVDAEVTDTPLAPPAPEPPTGESIHDELARKLTEAGVHVSEFLAYCASSRQFPNADSCGSIAEIPKAEVPRLLRGWTARVAAIIQGRPQ